MIISRWGTTQGLPSLMMIFLGGHNRLRIDVCTFEMPVRYDRVAALSPSKSSDAYIYSLVATHGHGLVANTSADEVVLVDRQTLAASPVEFFDDPPKGLTSLISSDVGGQEIVCAGSDGLVASYDVRSRKKVAQFKLGKFNTGTTTEKHGFLIFEFL